MGKKGSGWFSSVKKVFKKDSPRDKKENLDTKWQYEEFPAGSCSDLTNRESYDESSSHITGYGNQSKEESAATLIQSYYRGYLARRALRALKGLVRLQALVRGCNVRKQAQMTMRCMQAMLRVQAGVRAPRLKLVEEKLRERRDKSKQSVQKIIESIRRKQHAEMKRERALSYAYAYQQQKKEEQKWLQSDPFDEYEKPQQGWNWLERWVASQTHQQCHIPTDDMSEIDHFVNPMDCVPGYMAPTKSTKAKERTHGLSKPRSPPAAQWNTTAKKVIPRRFSYDSSAASSPRPKTSAKWMASYSPESSVDNRASMMRPCLHI